VRLYASITTMLSIACIATINIYSISQFLYYPASCDTQYFGPQLSLLQLSTFVLVNACAYLDTHYHLCTTFITHRA
jgi:hypothetical protein